jgi:NAD(P)-dependent dehydrogenase (short-subunit alcohol dehydrogenase family)
MTDVARRLEGRVAVVTGGGNGIGRAVAVRLAREGAQVVIGDLQTEAGGTTVSEVGATGGTAVFVRCDVTDQRDVAALARTAVDRFAGLHVVVTAAGISHAGYVSGDPVAGLEAMAANAALPPAEGFVNLDPADIQQVYDVNVTGTLLTMQACVAVMLAHGWANGASIVTIGSIAAKHPDTATLAYGLSKAAVWFLTKKAARDLAGERIRVNCVAPGFIETNMSAILAGLPEELRAPYLGPIPMRRMGTPAEVASTVAFLASDEASYFTGEILHPDGGYYTE